MTFTAGDQPDVADPCMVRARTDQVPFFVNDAVAAAVSFFSTFQAPAPLRACTSYVLPAATAVAQRSVQPLADEPLRPTGTFTTPVIDGWIVQR